MIGTANQIALEHAKAVWADEDARALWSIGELDVPPLIDAHLQRLEEQSLRGVDVLREATAGWVRP